LAFRATIATPAETFVLHGSPKIYVKTADSGSKRRHAFCNDCGTPIYACAIESPASYSLLIGTITQRAVFAGSADLAKFCAQLDQCARFSVCFRARLTMLDVKVLLVASARVQFGSVKVVSPYEV
jgi:hypothetical protein